MDNISMLSLLKKRESNTPDAIDATLKEILHVVRSHMNMDVAFISEFKKGMRFFELVDSAQASTVISAHECDPLEDTYCKKIVDNELPCIIQDTARNHITKNLDVTRKLSIGSYIGVPLKLPSGAVHGTLCCFRKEQDQTLNERDVLLLQAFSDISGRLIEKKRSHNHQIAAIESRVLSVLNPSVIQTHYQPIYDIKKEAVVGFESLTRFEREPYRSPDIWFKEAHQVDVGKELELMAIERALKHMPENAYLSVNISPEYVLDGSVLKILEQHPVDRLVLEITEHAPIQSYSDFLTAIEPLRKKGLRLAIDDVGAGFAGIQHILELHADIIKLDMSLVREIDSDLRKKALAAAIIAFAKETKCEVIAEGVETYGEFTELRSLGAHKAQGYFIGRPEPFEKAQDTIPFTNKVSDRVAEDPVNNSV